MTKALVVGPFDQEALARLRAVADVVQVPEITFESVRPHLSDVEVLVTRRLVVDAHVFAAAPRLRLVVKPGSGFDEIDVVEAQRRGIPVRNTPGVNAPAVAELTLGLLVGLVRAIPRHSLRLHDTRRWDREQGVELYGKTLGVVGVGHVGSRVARLGQALEMRVVGCDPYIDPATAAAPLLPFDELLVRSDVVSFHVPLTVETRDMVNARSLSRMKAGTFLLNMSRGEIVVESEVIAALDTGRLAGYAADVLPGEVPGMEVTSPLLDHPKVLLTPHLGAWTAETDRRVCHAAVAIVEHWVDAGTRVSRAHP
ncbi:MAG: NAD(P)-dependent oxidoreductase [Armatimonadota bacterium]|nr:NAD(P)-dependent oxidoreductase [Armatimonadota bacterium]